MELPDNNMNNEVENCNGIKHTSSEIIFDQHHQVFHPLTCMSMQDGTYTTGYQPSGSVYYDPLNHFDRTEETHGLQCEGFLTRVESYMNIPNPPVFSPGFIGQNKGHGGKKRKKNNESGMERLREVVHVRAKRGEATDSHSLAERLRREKINEKLKRLEDLMPGCYKTMGLSVMLDVVINYVRSLQIQIEIYCFVGGYFVSMKLSAASMFYDNSSGMDDMGSMKGTNGHEVQMMETTVGEGYGYGDFNPRFQSTWFP
ncbi:transcription factor bHLH62-like [Bidens hawaiensis]|uniref:transcription factor bHLH62-like n=1 Tax=Bidens hawaiensis TaxID=980011 RepID=UPI00404B5674